MNDKVRAFISKPEFAELIREYSSTYEKILDSSKYFKKGVFNHSNAETIAKNLKANGWFDGGHTVRLNDGGNGLEIVDEKQLAEAIEAEKLAILNNDELQASFEKVDKALSNVELRAFRDYLVANPTLLPELENYQYLKNKLWVGYLQKLDSDYLELVAAYDESEARLKEIIAQAEAEQTHWELVLEIFNTRFAVPFRVAIENKGDAVLGIGSPQIAFYFSDQNDTTEKKVERGLLDRVLSNGERRALYILNIIFEVEARKARSMETLFVIDDIADSFDYKNKYAIIEYLGDIRREENFHLLIMTHNFDFYRTIRSRLGVYGENKLLATRESDRISLQADDFSENPFTHWRGNLDNPRFLIASIPFIRNLAEYAGDSDSFQKLTSLLHIKHGSLDVTVTELKSVFATVLSDNSTDAIPDNDRPVLKLIFEVCGQLTNEDEAQVNLHAKVVLAIGIRLAAEEILIHLINDQDYVDSIQSNQTGKLIRKYEREVPPDTVILELMRRVSLMTPENIHLNSFMFEPILDMSAHHLQSLFTEVVDAKATLVSADAAGLTSR